MIPGYTILGSRLLVLLEAKRSPGCHVLGVAPTARSAYSRSQETFCYVDQISDPHAHFILALRRAEQALDSIGWAPWHPVQRNRFADACSVSPNSLQRVVEAMADQIDEPTLVVLEAPPGHGKTEAETYLALKLVSRLGHRGFYFALPTRATANQMLGRIERFLKHNSDATRVVLPLLHGNAMLVESFEDLLTRGRTSSGHEDADDNTLVVATDWFTGPKRGLLSSIAVGTIDQILLAALRTKHVFIRQMALANKVVIVDEVHAYDPYMLGLLERLVEWLAALGSSVILMSATLPTERRARLVNAYNRGRGRQAIARHGGPSGSAVTWATPAGAETLRFEPNRRASVAVRWIDGRLADGRGGSPFGEALERKLQSGGCAVVVCNIVGRAQEVYRTLRRRWKAGAFADTQLFLFHALLPNKDRARVEAEIVRKFGPRGERPARAVVVATQVIEQSLDLDFDLVVSDLARSICSFNGQVAGVPMALDFFSSVVFKPERASPESQNLQRACMDKPLSARANLIRAPRFAPHTRGDPLNRSVVRDKIGFCESSMPSGFDLAFFRLYSWGTMMCCCALSLLNWRGQCPKSSVPMDFSV